MSISGHGIGEYKTVVFGGSTTGVTPTVIWSRAISPGTIGLARCMFMGVADDSTKTFFKEQVYTYQRDGTDNITTPGTLHNNEIETDGGLNAGIGSDGFTTQTVTVIGLAVTNMNWIVKIEYMEVSE